MSYNGDPSAQVNGGIASVRLTRTCSVCGRSIRGPAFFIHERACIAARSGQLPEPSRRPDMYARVSKVRRRAGNMAEHRYIAERVLGRSLPKGAQVHHVNENRSDNRHENLVICEDSRFHHLLHRRARALAECGHAAWRLCLVCRKYDDPANMRRSPSASSYRHMECERRKNVARYDSITREATDEARG